MGVGFTVDIKKLDVCFGGFTPMALSDGIASQEQVALAEERMRERRAFLERLAVLEAARASEEREAADANGNVSFTMDELCIISLVAQPTSGASAAASTTVTADKGAKSPATGVNTTAVAAVAAVAAAGAAAGAACAFVALRKNN